MFTQVFAEQMVDYTGSDTLDPPLVFPLTTNVTLELSSWSEVSDLCGNGRLWGGMHFPVRKNSTSITFYIQLPEVSPLHISQRAARALNLM